MFFGYTLLLPIFDEDEAVYLSKVQERYWQWRQIIRQFINRLFERRHPSTDTHGESNPERWTFHVPGTQWYEMQRLNEHWSYVDLEGELEVRRALMGISLLHYMASGNNYPDWINEYEGVMYPPLGANQYLHPRQCCTCASHVPSCVARGEHQLGHSSVCYPHGF
jgi:hypothetical protein